MSELRLQEKRISLPVESGEQVSGDLVVPAGAAGIVVFAHGSGSGRLSSRNRRVAGTLQDAGFATFLFDLLTPSEEERDEVTAELRFDIPFLAGRLGEVAGWVGRNEELRALPVGSHLFEEPGKLDEVARLAADWFERYLSAA